MCDSCQKNTFQGNDDCAAYYRSDKGWHDVACADVRNLGRAIIATFKRIMLHVRRLSALHSMNTSPSCTNADIGRCSQKYVQGIEKIVGKTESDATESEAFCAIFISTKSSKEFAPQIKFAFVKSGSEFKYNITGNVIYT